MAPPKRSDSIRSPVHVQKTFQYISEQKGEFPPDLKKASDLGLLHPKQEDTDQEREYKRTRTLFKRLIKIVDTGDGGIDFSKHLAADSEFPALSRGKTSLPKNFQPSHLKKLLRGQNLLHYAISQPITEEEEDDDDYDSDDQDDEANGPETKRTGAQPSVIGIFPETRLGRRCNFVMWLLKEYPEMLSQRTMDNKTPLCLLIEQCQSPETISDTRWLESYVKGIREVLTWHNDNIRDQFKTILNYAGHEWSMDRTNGTLVHLAIQYLGTNIIPFLYLVESQTMNVQDGNGSTPLHVAVNINEWKIGESSQQRLRLIEGLLEKCGKEALKLKYGHESWRESLRKSPYLFMMSCVKSDTDWRAQAHKDAYREAEYLLKNAYMLLLEDYEIIDHLHGGKKGRLVCHKLIIVEFG